MTIPFRAETLAKTRGLQQGHVSHQAWIVATLFSFFATACTWPKDFRPTAVQRASSDWGCDPAQLEATGVSGEPGALRVRGCGHEDLYYCHVMPDTGGAITCAQLIDGAAEK